MTPKSIAKLVQENFKQTRDLNYPWFIVGMSISDNGDQHFVLFCENANCYCRATVSSKEELTYLKFHC